MVTVRAILTQSLRSLLYLNKASFSSCSRYRLFTQPTNSSLQVNQIICQVRTMAALSPRDPSSFSLPELAIIQHIDLKWNVNFDNKTLSGSARLDFDVLANVSELVLDSRDLSIQSVSLEGAPLQYSVGPEVKDFGAKLTVTLPAPAAAGDKLSILVDYSTAPTASALQWLEPRQTAGRRHPFLYSQCQPIHARSILPCQDTPAVKFTYTAAVSAPAPLTPLMSALRVPAGAGAGAGVAAGAARFSQPVPVPSYLVALAVGELESEELGPSTAVWAEPASLGGAAREFAPAERQLAAAARAAGAYEWTRAELLLLPPAFPYGGMENPCLTFVTPTLLAGDRSLADVIVHEIMHSWTGNLVTNRNFEHFWLNEGFTVFMERKVMGALIGGEEGRRARDFHSLLGLKELKEAITLQGENNPLTKLVVDLRGVHPDDAFSRVPYEKGSLFLRYLEDLFGLESFDKFMLDYIAHFRRRSIDTEDFRRYLLQYYAGHERLSEVEWDRWLHEPGMPPVVPAFDTSMSKEITEVVPLIVAHETVSEDVLSKVSTFAVHQLITLLQELLEQPPLALDKMAQLDSRLGLGASQNKEITYRWLRMSVRSRDSAKLPEVFAFLNEIGRMKYVRPIYRELYAWEEVRQQTVDNFLANEPSMMHVSAYTLRKDLHLRNEQSKEVLP